MKIFGKEADIGVVCVIGSVVLSGLSMLLSLQGQRAEAKKCAEIQLKTLENNTVTVVESTKQI